MKSLTAGHLKTGLDSMRRAKWRNFWTMLGVIIGVSSVISIVGIGEGVKQQISGRIQHVGSDLITVRPAQLGASGATPLLTGVNITGTLSKQDADSVRSLPEVAAATPLIAVAGDIIADNGSYNGGLVIGTSADFPDVINQKLAYGAYFSDDDDSVPVAVLGAAAADKMFKEQVPLGRTFTLHGKQFMVRGILNSFDSTPLSAEANFNTAVFIPSVQAEELTNNSASVYEILVKPKLAKQSAHVVASIKSKVGSLHGGQGDFSVLRQSDSRAASSDVLSLLTNLVAGVAAISLIVGGIGIMNVMSVSIVERLHEIGIRKAIGATNRQILSQFLVESTTLSLIGGVIGILIAALLNVGLRLTTNLRPVLSWQIIVLATGVSLIVGIVFGSFPAFKAARKDPIEALRAD